MIHSQFREIGWTEWTRVTLRFFAYVCGSFVRSSSSLIPNLGKLVGLSGLEPPTSCLSGMRSNHLSYNPLSWVVRPLWSAFAVVEMMGFEPMTPCLQGRCSPNWATPPFGVLCVSQQDSLKIEQQTETLLFIRSPYVWRFSLERRWSSRTFRYGYLVTT